MRRRDKSLSLESAHNNGRRYLLLLSKCDNGSFAELTAVPERPIGVGRDQDVTRKTIRIILFTVGLRGDSTFGSIHELTATRTSEHVACLMKEAKPEMIVSLVPQA